MPPPTPAAVDPVASAAGAPSAVPTPTALGASSKNVRAYASQDRLLAISVDGEAPVAAPASPLPSRGSPLPAGTAAPLTPSMSQLSMGGSAAGSAVDEALITNFATSAVEKLAGCTILVIDDFSLCLEAMQVMCGLWGMRVICCRDPLKAVEWVKQGKAPDPVSGGLFPAAGCLVLIMADAELRFVALCDFSAR